MDDDDPETLGLRSQLSGSVMMMQQHGPRPSATGNVWHAPTPGAIDEGRALPRPPPRPRECSIIPPIVADDCCCCRSKWNKKTMTMMLWAVVVKRGRVPPVLVESRGAWLCVGHRGVAWCVGVGAATSPHAQPPLPPLRCRWDPRPDPPLPDPPERW